jgi:hypothetical protein
VLYGVEYSGSTETSTYVARVGVQNGSTETITRLAQRGLLECL